MFLLHESRYTKKIQILILVSNYTLSLSYSFKLTRGIFSVPFKPLLTENDSGEISPRNGNAYSTTRHNLVHVQVTPRQTPQADLWFAMCLLLVWFLKIWVCSASRGVSPWSPLYKLKCEQVFFSYRMYKPHPLYIPNIHVKTFGFFSVAISGSASEIRVCHKTENQSRPRKRIWGLVGLLSVRLGLVSIVLVIFFST